MPSTSYISGSERRTLYIMLGIGAVGIVAGLGFGAGTFWPTFLVDAIFFLTLGLGGVVFVAVNHVSNSAWSTAIRRVPEAMSAYLPFGAVALLICFFGRESLYEWSHWGARVAHESSAFKTTYLSTPFFFARMAAILGVWIWLARLLRRESYAQDVDIPSDTTVARTLRLRKYSALFLALFGLTFTVASFDWIMSLEPEFYSTIFAFYVFSGLFVAGIACITLLVLLLQRRGYLSEVHAGHLHSLGKLLFAFTTFWAYIWLCQYLLVYYANLPEETAYYLRRTTDPGWNILFLSNIALGWIVPFGILQSRGVKRSGHWLIAASAVVLVGHWLDLYLMIVPANAATPTFGLVDLALAVGFLALFLLAFVHGLAAARLVPVNDPYLEESLWHEHREEPEAVTARNRGGNRTLVVSTLAFTVACIVWGAIGATAPIFRNLYHLTDFETALLVALPVIAGALGRVPAGMLVYRYGAGKVFGAILIVAALSVAAASFGASYGLLIVWSILAGVAGSVFPAGVSLVTRWFSGEQQGAALGIFGLGNVGQSIAYIAAPALAVSVGMELSFRVLGAIAGVCGLAMLLLTRRTDADAGVIRERSVPWRSLSLWTLSLFYFLTFGGFLALGIYLPTFLTGIFGLSALDAGGRVAGYALVAVLMRPVGGWIADRFGGARVLLVTFSSTALLSLGLISGNLFVFTIGALGVAAMLGAGSGAVTRMVVEFFPGAVATVSGIVGAVGGIGGFFPLLVLYIVYDRTGSYTLGFLSLSCFALACLAVNYLSFVRREDTRRRPFVLD